MNSKIHKIGSNEEGGDHNPEKKLKNNGTTINMF